MSNIADITLKTRHKFIRTCLYLIRVPDYKSKADCWPWIKVKQAEEDSYEVCYFGSTVCTTSPLTDFNHTAGDIAIIGSGPSIKMMDFDKISKLNCVLLNGAISLADTYGIQPLACVIVDSTFIENRFDILSNLPAGSRMILTPGVIRAISERDSQFLSDKRVYLTQNILRPVYNPGQKFVKEQADARQARFSFDLDSGYLDGGTVMSVAIQLAHQIKPENTYLVGLDIGNAAAPRFYETGKNKLNCGLMSDYEKSILPFMKAASGIFSRDGLSIYNCSPITLLPYEIIPYCDDFCTEPEVSRKAISRSGQVSTR